MSDGKHASLWTQNTNGLEGLTGWRSVGRLASFWVWAVHSGVLSLWKILGQNIPLWGEWQHHFPCPWFLFWDMGIIPGCCKASKGLGWEGGGKGAYVLLEACQHRTYDLLTNLAFLHCYWITGGETSVILYHTKNGRDEFTSPAAC